MKKRFQVKNVKCGGCANTLKQTLFDEFGEVEVNLEVEPREIILDIDEDRIEDLKSKLREIGYPLLDDKLSTIQDIKATAKSFVSCAIGKIDI